MPLANKRVTILILVMSLMLGSTKVWGMALFDFLKVTLFSEVNGRVLKDGSPVAGAEITRTAIYNQENHSETTLSDENGAFRFKPLHVHSVNKILPSEVVITQNITIRHDGKEYRGWKTVKRTTDEKDELSKYLSNLSCDLSADEKQTETYRGVIAGICQI